MFYFVVVIVFMEEVKEDGLYESYKGLFIFEGLF